MTCKQIIKTAALAVSLLFLGSILSVRNARAEAEVRYKVINLGKLQSVKEYERLLNSFAAQGWVVDHTVGNGVIVVFRNRADAPDPELPEALTRSVDVAKALNKDQQAKITLKAVETAVEMYAAEKGAYPAAKNPGDLKTELEESGLWPKNISFNDGGKEGLEAGALTGYNGSASTYVITAQGNEPNRYYHYSNISGFTGPDDKDTIASPH